MRAWGLATSSSSRWPHFAANTGAQLEQRMFQILPVCDSARLDPACVLARMSLVGTLGLF